VHALLLCNNEAANAEEMLCAQMNPPDSSAVLKQELILGGCSVQRASLRVLPRRQINKIQDNRLYLKRIHHDSAGFVL